LDAAAARIAHSRGAVELALGEALARLFDGDGLIRLGYARQVDYARERLGVPPRTMYEWVRLARALEGRPMLRRAVLDGSVTPRKALAVAPLAVESQEAHWVAVATQLPLTELASLVQVHGADAPEGYGNVESLILRMTPEQQMILDQAIRIAFEQTGYAVPRWQCVEIICQEWLGAFGKWQLDWEETASCSSAPLQRVAKHLRVVGEAHRPLAPRESVAELDGRIQTLLEGRRGFDVAFGAVARELTSGSVLRVLGYRGLDEYCRERLGVSPRSFRERAWLERQMDELPPLRAALETGKLTYSKALLVAKDAQAWDVEERIVEAAGTTWQQVERESTAAEDRRNLALGVRRIWGPEDAVRTVALAIASAKSVAEASRLGSIESGEALALIAMHFVGVWEIHKCRRPGPSRREVLSRHGGLCGVPGCSRPAQHEHHIHYRSRGGSDDSANLLGLCAVHHLRGVHADGLEVIGTAGERLEWRFGSGERWTTVGADCVRGAPPGSEAG